MRSLHDATDLSLRSHLVRYFVGDTQRHTYEVDQNMALARRWDRGTDSKVSALSLFNIDTLKLGSELERYSFQIAQVINDVTLPAISARSYGTDILEAHFQVDMDHGSFRSSEKSQVPAYHHSLSYHPSI